MPEPRPASPTLQEKIETLLDERVRPILAKDGGAVRIEALREDGRLLLIYAGRCAGCPAVEWTHRHITLPALKAGLAAEITAVEWRPEL